jgi:hypothetical protein
MKSAQYRPEPTAHVDARRDATRSHLFHSSTYPADMAERSATEAMEVSLDTLRGAFTVFL